MRIHCYHKLKFRFLKVSPSARRVPKLILSPLTSPITSKVQKLDQELFPFFSLLLSSLLATLVLFCDRASWHAVYFFPNYITNKPSILKMSPGQRYHKKKEAFAWQSYVYERV